MSSRQPGPRDAPVGGQAVLEGVMMRGVRTWAVAVRRPDGAIDVRSFGFAPLARRHRALRLPVIRGVGALAESLSIGLEALGLSARGEDDEPVSGAAWGGTIALSLVFAVGLFFVVPVAVTSLVRDRLGSAVLFWLVEGALRTAILLAYLALVSRLRDLRRVFAYHGAEHQAIACYEAGEPLVPARAAGFSRLHPRCGTSFLLVVMLVAIVVFAPLGLPAWYVLVPTRVAGVPVVAGLSFEVVRWAGRHRGAAWVRAVMWPGMQLQRLTTRPPDHDQLAVAIAALEAVLAVEDPRAAAAEDRVGIEVAA